MSEFGPLQEASIDELIDELKRRSLASLIVLDRKVEEGDDQRWTGVWWDGGLVTACGLADYADKYFAAEVALDRAACRRNHEEDDS